MATKRTKKKIIENIKDLLVDNEESVETEETKETVVKPKKTTKKTVSKGPEVKILNTNNKRLMDIYRFHTIPAGYDPEVNQRLQGNYQSDWGDPFEVNSIYTNIVNNMTRSLATLGTLSFTNTASEDVNHTGPTPVLAPDGTTTIGTSFDITFETTLNGDFSSDCKVQSSDNLVNGYYLLEIVATGPDYITIETQCSSDNFDIAGGITKYSHPIHDDNSGDFDTYVFIVTDNSTNRPLVLNFDNAKSKTDTIKIHRLSVWKIDD